jgi:hypothetical protein
MKILKFILPLLVLGFMSCSDDDEKGDLSLVFNTQYDGQELLMQTDYTYPSGGNIKFSRVSYYLDDLTIDEGDNNLEGGVIRYLDFSDRSVASDPIVEKSYTFTDIEAGLYNDITFNVGVNSVDNAKTPADFDPSNPLSESAEYWGGWKSYVFAKFEGVYTPTTGDPIPFALHLGGDPALMNINLTKAINVKEDQSNKIEITLDVNKVFGSDKIYDIVANPSLHSVTHEPFVLELARNLEKSFSTTVK